MQEDAGQLQEELMTMKDRLAATEGERDRIRSELKEVTKTADEANGRPTEAMSSGKVADVFSELNSAMESLTKSNEEIKIKELTIASLKAELVKAKELEAQLAEKGALLDKLKEELTKAQLSEASALDFLSKSKERIEQLETEIVKGQDLEMKMLDSLAAQTKRLEQTKILLEESKLEVTSPHDEVDKMGGSPDKISNERKTSFQEEFLGSLKSELRIANENLARAQEAERHSSTKAEGLLKEIELLRTELKQATGAEQNSKKAMDDLALALTEVAAEANQTREKLIKAEDELELLTKETQEFKEKFRKNEVMYKTLLDEARKEADLYRNTADRLRLEAEESLLAWNDKETGFVDCIKTAEDEKTAALEENNKLLEALTAAENLNITAKQENQNLRDILKQALNEANVAKEAAEIARTENSQLKDLVAEKDDALIFITRENENLRINEAAANENIKELKRLLDEASGKEFKSEEQEQRVKSQSSTDKEPPQQKERKLSHAFSLNLRDLIIHSKHKDTHDDQKIPEKLNEHEEQNEDLENADPLKGSIFDVDSPVAAAAAAANHQHQHNHHHGHHRRKSSTFTDDEAFNPEDLEHLDHNDEAESERNSRKNKKALLRRFGDIIIRRKGVHRRESSIGGEGQKKEPSSVGSEGHKKEPPSAGAEGHKESLLGADHQTLRKENSLGD